MRRIVSSTSRIFAVIFMCFSVWGASARAAVDWAGTEFDRIEGNTIHFRNPKDPSRDVPKPIKSSFYELSYIGLLRPSASAASSPPWFLFKGRPCQSCLQDTAIYAIRPTDTKATSFVFPGKVLDSKTRAVILESRAFYGQCLRERGDREPWADVYVVFQNERIEKKKRHGGGGRQVKHEQSVFVAEAAADHLKERLMERGLPRLGDTLKLVRSGRCAEIEGRNRLMISRPVVSGPWDDATDDDDASKDATPDHGDAGAPAADEPAAASEAKSPAPKAARQNKKPRKHG